MYKKIAKQRMTAVLLLLSAMTILGCAEKADEGDDGWVYLHVTATAYTSRVEETDSTPFTAAWGDRLDQLEPGIKAVAVSPDLLDMGLTRHSKLYIEGLPGEYHVMDVMSSRWTKRIDLYYGLDLRKALDWGRKKVRIYWRKNEPDVTLAEE